MEKLYRFRKYKKKQGKKNVRHPKLIVDDYEHEYGFMGLTTSSTKGKRHKNIRLTENPQIVKGVHLREKSFLRRKIEYDKKRNFGPILNDYKLSKTDRDNIESFVKTRKKKR